MNDNHWLLKFFGISLALGLNDKHNEQMLREGRRIPWWKRHFLLIIFLVMMSPVVIVGTLIIMVNVLNPSAGTMEAFGTFLGWAIPVVLVAGGALAYRNAEKRWRSNAGTTIVEVRRDV